MSKKDFLSIIAPVKDEEENIAWALEKIKKIVKPKHEILIVYDDDNDKTIPIIKSFKKNGKYKNIRLVKNVYKKGVLNAIKTGMLQAKGNIIVVMAVDRTDDPRTINTMYKKFLEGYQVICPTRYSKGGKANGPTTIKSLLSRASGLSTPYVLGIPTSDLTYSFKMFTKDVLDAIEIESVGGFEFAEELLIKAYHHKFKTIEVPTVWIDRRYGKSKFKLFSWLPRYIKWYLLGIKLRAKRILN